MWMEGLSQMYKMIEQDGLKGWWQFHDELFISTEIVEYIWGYWNDPPAFEHVICLKTVWVPHHKRGLGLFKEHLKIFTEWCDMFGTALITCCNPYDLSDEYDPESYASMEDHFRKEVGFHYKDDYKAAKFRQRKRFQSEGFKNSKFGRIGDKKRIKRKDMFVYSPDKLIEKLKCHFMTL